MAAMDEDLWTDILHAFEQEAGEPPASKPEGWELCLLARVAANHLESTKSLRKTVAKRIERLLLAAEPRLDDCRGVLARGLGNVFELSAPIQEAHALLENAGSAWKNQHDAVEATLGPPAFFPVGNAAGRFGALTDGLAPEGELRLLFIGASDPRHLLKALHPLTASACRVTCVTD
eukprot:s6258_g1.t3